MSNSKASDKTPKAGRSMASKEMQPEKPQSRGRIDQVGEINVPQPTAAAPQPPTKAAPRRRPPRAAAPATAASPPLDAILTDLRNLRESVESLRSGSPTAGHGSDADLEASVDSLRRLLSELIEQRMESVVKEIVGVRREAATGAERDRGRVVARLDQLLEKLGAVRFDGEPMDLVDPVIHEVVDERTVNDAPDGVIVRTVRPGYRTARGTLVCKAAVAINRRA